jgi:hypothetical protein
LRGSAIRKELGNNYCVRGNVFSGIFGKGNKTETTTKNVTIARNAHLHSGFSLPGRTEIGSCRLYSAVWMGGRDIETEEIDER